jgi:hypothetical protein
MDIGNIFSPGSTGNNQREVESTFTRPRRPPNNSALTRGENLFVGDFEPQPRRDLRALVAHRFMLMNEAHNRIRTKLLGSRSPISRARSL